MIYQLEVRDDDLEYVYSKLFKEFRPLRNSFYSAEESERCSRLLDLGIIEQDEYYGESICYNPTYHLTKLGKSVMAQYVESPDVAPH